ncbi:putative nuclease HARBI1 [Haliotis asinina]|uniref:putative nuclease HARBI1 n=1 Tax=Haliotis asinina TaxID=109174 RepID=UPI0035322333
MAAYIELGLTDEDGDEVIKVPLVFRERTRQLDTLDDAELISRYRLPRMAIMQLTDMVEPYPGWYTRRSVTLSPEIQITTLRFLEKGCFQRAIDRALIPTKRSPANEEAVCVPKGLLAVNVQAICDADMRFLNVVSKWPGSTHDSFIRQNSATGIEFETNPPLASWRLRAGENYNNAHCRTRNVVEKTFGIFNSRFRCLHKSAGALWSSVQVSHKIVYVAAHLHNLCMRLPPPPEADEENVDEEAQQIHGAAPAAAAPQHGLKTRRQLVTNVFT